MDVPLSVGLTHPIPPGGEGGGPPPPPEDAMLWSAGPDDEIEWSAGDSILWTDS